MLLLLLLTGCLGMEDTAPIVRRSDLAVVPDYSGTYLPYEIDSDGRPGSEPSGPVMFFDKVSEGEYRFAAKTVESELPVFGGYLYLLDVAAQDEVVGVIYAKGREGESQVLFIRIRRMSEYRFDIAAFEQTNDDTYAVLEAVARRHGLVLDPDRDGRILGQPTTAQLRAAYLDEDFLPNVDFKFGHSYLRQDRDARWPEKLVIDKVSSSGLAIEEDVPG